MRALATPLTALIAALIFAHTATAEVELSLNVQGTAEEIAAVLQLLQQAGLAGGAGNLQVQVESTFARPGETPAENAPTTPPPPPSPPAPVMGSPLVAPSAIAPGAAAVLSVQVVDPERKVDTIAAIVGDNLLTGNLYDNGQNGDAAAGDGRWSLLLAIPAALPDGSYTITFHAFDAQGVAVTTPGSDGTSVPLEATAGLLVRR